MAPSLLGRAASRHPTGSATFAGGAGTRICTRGRATMAAMAPIREGRVPVIGGSIWYKVIGEGEGVPLVTVHGGPGFTHDYLEPLEALAGERPVVFYDQLGAG